MATPLNIAPTMPRKPWSVPRREVKAVREVRPLVSFSLPCHRSRRCCGRVTLMVLGVNMSQDCSAARKPGFHASIMAICCAISSSLRPAILVRRQGMPPSPAPPNASAVPAGRRPCLHSRHGARHAHDMAVGITTGGWRPETEMSCRIAEDYTGIQTKLPQVGNSAGIASR